MRIGYLSSAVCSSDLFFDCATRDGFAAGLDHVLLSIDDAQVTLAGDHAEIAAVEPAVAKCLGRDRGILPIAERHMRAAMDDLANRARRHRSIVVIDDAGFAIGRAS